MAIFAISAADFLGGSNDSGPYRSCGSLRDGLPLERWLALLREWLISLLDDLFDCTAVDVASQFGVDDSGMDCGRSYSAIAVVFVEGNREENVCRFGSAIGDEGLIWSLCEVGILEVDIRIAVT